MALLDGRSILLKGGEEEPADPDFSSCVCVRSFYETMNSVANFLGLPPIEETIAECYEYFDAGAGVKVLVALRDGLLDRRQAEEVGDAVHRLVEAPHADARGEVRVRGLLLPAF